ncbi:MAG: hypothetical protein ABI370_09410, partial [Gammaproteobacteria bacterium]
MIIYQALLQQQPLLQQRHQAWQHVVTPMSRPSSKKYLGDFSQLKINKKINNCYCESTYPQAFLS